MGKAVNFDVRVHSLRCERLAILLGGAMRAREIGCEAGAF